MRLFSTDIRIFATAYVWAKDEQEAQAKLQSITRTCIEVPNDPNIGEGLCIDGRPFPRLKSLKRVALSPAMTIDQQLIPITMIEEVELEPELPANDLH